MEHQCNTEPLMVMSQWNRITVLTQQSHLCYNNNILDIKSNINAIPIVFTKILPVYYVCNWHIIMICFDLITELKCIVCCMDDIFHVH